MDERTVPSIRQRISDGVMADRKHAKVFLCDEVFSASNPALRALCLALEMLIYKALKADRHASLAMTRKDRAGVLAAHVS